MPFSHPSVRTFVACLTLLLPSFFVLVLSPTGQAPAPVSFYVSAEIPLTRGSSDGFGNESADDGFANDKTEGGTPRSTPVDLLPNGDVLLDGWSDSSGSCQTDAVAFDELDEDPPDTATCRRAQVSGNVGIDQVTTAMQNLTSPPGVVDDIDVTGVARAAYVSGDDGGYAALMYSGSCGGSVGGTSVPGAGYVTWTALFPTCPSGSEWNVSLVDALQVSSLCVNDLAMTQSEICLVTQHKAVVDVAYRDDFSLNFTSQFDTVAGPDLVVVWECTTTDDEGLDMYVDGALRSQGVCLSAGTGSMSIPAIGLPRSVNVIFASPMQAGDVTESTYSFDVLRIDSRNNAPVADAGPDQAVATGTLVTLNGSASMDPDGDTLEYTWALITGPPVTLNGETTATPAFTPMTAGTYVFSLDVDDRFSGTSRDWVNVTVWSRPPVAVLGASPVRARVGETFTFDGSGSTDSDGTIVEYAFDFGDGDDRIGAAVQAVHSYANPGTYTVILTVTDDDGNTSSAQRTIIVDPPEFPWWTVLVLLALLVLVLILFLLYRRRKKAARAPEPAPKPRAEEPLPEDWAEGPEEGPTTEAAPAGEATLAAELSPADEAADRLAQLEQMRTEGVITDQEYQAKRKEVLGRL